MRFNPKARLDRSQVQVRRGGARRGGGAGLPIPIPAGTGGKIGEIKDEVKWYEKVCARIVDIFVERSEGGITEEDFKKGWERADWWLDSKESLARGFVDEIG